MKKDLPNQEFRRIVPKLKEKGYGMRWPASEGIFSGQKRIFGEYVSAMKKRNMYHEVKLKFWAYNKLKELA